MSWPKESHSHLPEATYQDPNFEFYKRQKILSAQTLLIAFEVITIALDISFLALDFFLAKRVIVTGPVEVDDIALARVFQNRSVPTERVLSDTRKFQMAKLPSGVRNFRNDAFSRPHQTST
jgi:hypothetical protein